MNQVKFKSLLVGTIYIFLIYLNPALGKKTFCLRKLNSSLISISHVPDEEKVMKPNIDFVNDESNVNYVNNAETSIHGKAKEYNEKKHKRQKDPETYETVQELLTKDKYITKDTISKDIIEKKRVYYFKNLFPAAPKLENPKHSFNMNIALSENPKDAEQLLNINLLQARKLVSKLIAETGNHDRRKEKH